ncbi:MAG: YfcC family protein [Proteobacteria bacterium]|nr:YfcC family protein [Pseudomonadota bacterium]
MAVADNAIATAPSSPVHGARHRGSIDPVIMMLVAILAAMVLTWTVPSGEFMREGHGRVVPGSYHLIAKDLTAKNFAIQKKSTPALAAPAAATSVVTSIVEGMKHASGLIFMIMFLGGMFGILRATGALDRAIDLLVARAGGRVHILVPIIMLALSAGSAFLGLISEYLLVIPIMIALSKRLGLSALFALAVVAVPAKIGYLTSVANPVALLVAQPLLDLPVFSGLWLRFAMWVVFLTIGIGYVLWMARTQQEGESAHHEARPLTGRETAIMVVLGLAVCAIVFGSTELGWKATEVSAFYIALGAVIALLAGMKPATAAHALVDGMKSMVLAALLVGMAAGIDHILRDGKVLDSIINALSSLVSGQPPVIVAEAMVGIEMVMTVLIPSTSAKAALSMPILGPIAGLSGVSAQTTVLAFLCGNGLINMISPTSGMLLAYCATAGVPFTKWFRFAIPLALVLAVLCLISVAIAVAVGYT